MILPIVLLAYLMSIKEINLMIYGFMLRRCLEINYCPTMMKQMNMK